MYILNVVIGVEMTGFEIDEKNQTLSSNYILSDNESKVLEVLKKNARMSLEQIAKESGLTRQTVVKIIKKLEDANVILGYQPNINYNLLGYKIFILLAKVKPDFNFKLMGEAIKRTEIRKKGAMLFYAGYFNGKYDFYVAFGAHDLAHATSIVNYISNPFSDVIQEIVLEEALINIAFNDIFNPMAIEQFKKLFNE